MMCLWVVQLLLSVDPGCDQPAAVSSPAQTPTNHETGTGNELIKRPNPSSAEIKTIWIKESEEGGREGGRERGGRRGGREGGDRDYDPR